MEYIAKYISPSMAEIVKVPADPDRLMKYIEDGFVEFVPAVEPIVCEGQMIHLSYSLKNGKVVQAWIVAEDPLYYAHQVEALKANLSSSDYKVIKCYESSMIGEAMPYDIGTLVTNRQDIRDEIRRLESIIENL